MKDETKLTTLGRNHEQKSGAVNPPVVHASTVLFPTYAELRAAVKNRHDVFFYGRFGTPTTKAFCDAMAELEGGAGCAVFPSGVAAITTSVLTFARPGDHILVPSCAYEATLNFCNTMLRRLGVESTFYDPCVGAAIENLVRANTRLILLESPGSLTFEVQDVPAIVEVARRHDMVTIMDNTWATPLYFKPLAHGVDISVQAATKYIVGHADAMIGTAAANGQTWPRLRTAALRLGQCAAPDDAYLALRGLRTLGVRLRQHQDTALKLARWFAGRAEVQRVLHPALPGDPGHAIWRRDFSGASGLFGVVLKKDDDDALAALLDNLDLFAMGFSWGGYESLILPVKSDPESGPLLRVHAGLEDPDDLIADLEKGFERYSAATG
ncbi:MAG: cystathionine beta-lyase [Sphingomonadales bacterium]